MSNIYKKSSIVKHSLIGTSLLIFWLMSLYYGISYAKSYTLQTPIDGRTLLAIVVTFAGFVVLFWGLRFIEAAHWTYQRRKAVKHGRLLDRKLM